MRGSGRWRFDGVTLSYEFGEHAGAARVTPEGERLVLDCIPGVLVGKGTPCRFQRVRTGTR